MNDDYRAYPAYFEVNVANQRDVGLHYAWPSIRHDDLLRTTVACTFSKTTERPAGIFRFQQETGVARNGAFLNLSRKSEMAKTSAGSCRTPLLTTTRYRSSRATTP